MGLNRIPIYSENSIKNHKKKRVRVCPKSIKKQNTKKQRQNKNKQTKKNKKKNTWITNQPRDQREIKKKSQRDQKWV